MTMQQASGLGEQINTPTSPAPSGEPQTIPAVTGAPITPGTGVNLFDLPEFRQWQSRSDQQLAQERQARQQTEQRLAELEAQQQQAELDRLDSLDPEEQNKILRRRLSQQNKAAEEQRINQQYVAQAQAMLEAAGLTWKDPRIQSAIQLGPTPQAIAALGIAIATIARQDTEAAKLAAQVQAQKQAEAQRTQTQIVETRARQEALADAGVAVTSGAAPSAVAPRDDRADMIAGFRSRMQKLVSAGKNSRSPEVMQLHRDLREKGLTLADIR